MVGRRVALLCAGLAVIAAGPAIRAAAREPQIASERSAGPIVDFIALNPNGLPVDDLQSSDIEIRVADRVRAIRSLRRVSAAPVSTVPAVTARVPAPYGTNDEVAAGRRFVIVVDQESFAAGREHLFRDAVEGLLAQLTPADRTMVAALPFGGVVVPFTADIARVRLATGRITGQAARGETGSDLACRTRRFLESLEALLRNQGAQPLPQTLILFTAGLAAPRRDAPMGLLPGMCELLVETFRHVATAASVTRANFYVLPPADIGIGSSLARSNIAGIGDNGSDNPLEGIEHLVGATGGVRLPLDATGTASLLKVTKESGTYYAAELEPVQGEAIGRSRSLNVRVARRGIIVRVRPEVTFTPPARTTTRLTVSDILASTEAATDVRLRVGGFTVRDPDGKLRVGVLVEAADASAALASAGAILIDAGGRVVAHWTARDAAERPLLGAMTAPPGAYRVRVAAIDVSGRPGAAETDVEAGLTDVGGLSLGSLLLGVSRNGVTSLQLEFGAETTARASFDIYGGTTGQQLSARLEVARDLDGPPMVAVPLALTRADDTRVVATGAVPLGALAPGDYVVRGMIRLEDGTTGRVVRTLRKR